MFERMAAEFVNRRGQIGLAVLAGALYAAGFCGYEQWLASWFCLVPLLWAIDDATLKGRHAFLLGWACGATAHLAVYTWLIGMLRDFGGLPLPLAVLGYVLLCLAQSSWFGFWGFTVHQLSERLKVPIVWSAPVLMIVWEWIYPALFPSYLADSQYRQTTLIQSVDIWGILGVSFIVAMSSSVLYAIAARVVRRRGQFPLYALIAFAALLIFDIVYGIAAVGNIDDTVANAPKKIRIGLVQTNMGIYDKSQRPAEGLRRHREQSLEVERQGAQLIVWPESGYNYAIREGTTNVAGTVLGPVSTPLIFGGLRTAIVDNERHVWNSAYLVDGGGNVLGTYDKTFLLAFGEYLPFGDWLPFLYELSPNTSKFDRGTHTRPLVYDGVKYGMLICYEDILPGFVNDVMESDPDILVNITNDAWFGPTREPLIHLALATFRAIEHRRFLVRSTNTGISAFIDPAGRILGATQVFARANSVHDVAALQVHTIYGVIGDLVGWICVFVSLAWCWPWFRDAYDRFSKRYVKGPKEHVLSSEPGDRAASFRDPSSPSTPRPRRSGRRRR